MTKISDATTVTFQGGDYVPVSRAGDGRALKADVSAAIAAALAALADGDPGDVLTQGANPGEMSMQPPAGGDPGYLEYVALLNQAGTNAPVATVIANSLGFVPTYSRAGAGDYSINSINGFTNNKTVVNITNVAPGYFPYWSWASTSSINIGVFDAMSTGADDTLISSLIIVRIYD